MKRDFKEDLKTLYYSGTKNKNNKMGNIITFFNHKGGVGKTTLVHNLAFLLADKNKKVLLIDADPQMNLTASIFGLSTNVEYNTNEESIWSSKINKYLSVTQYIDSHINEEGKIDKEIYSYAGKENIESNIDLIMGDINISSLDYELLQVVQNKKSRFTEKIPYKFEDSIRQLSKKYDFVLIDTSPSSSSILNAFMVFSSDYFIAPVSPSFFSLQAIDNLPEIFRSWNDVLGEYQSTNHFQGLSFRVKFLGIVIQMGKRHIGGIKGFASSTTGWSSKVNESIKKFTDYANSKYCISQPDFKKYYSNSEPYIIELCCDFTQQLRTIAEKEGIPIISLTQEICKKHNANVDLEKDNGQYKKAFESIKESYNNIAEGLIKL